MPVYEGSKHSLNVLFRVLGGCQTASKKTEKNPLPHLRILHRPSPPSSIALNRNQAGCCDFVI